MVNECFFFGQNQKQVKTAMLLFQSQKFWKLLFLHKLPEIWKLAFIGLVLNLSWKSWDFYQGSSSWFQFLFFYLKSKRWCSSWEKNVAENVQLHTVSVFFFMLLQLTALCISWQRTFLNFPHDFLVHVEKNFSFPKTRKGDPPHNITILAII